MIFAKRFKRYVADIITTRAFGVVNKTLINNRLIWRVDKFKLIYNIRNYTIIMENRIIGICYSVTKTIDDYSGYLFIRFNFKEPEIIKGVVKCIDLFEISIKSRRARISVGPHDRMYALSRTYKIAANIM